MHSGSFTTHVQNIVAAIEGLRALRDPTFPSLRLPGSLHIYVLLFGLLAAHLCPSIRLLAEAKQARELCKMLRSPQFYTDGPFPLWAARCPARCTMQGAPPTPDAPHIDAAAELFRHARVRFDRQFHKCKHLHVTNEPNRWRVTFPPSDDTKACVIMHEIAGHLRYFVVAPGGEPEYMLIRLKSGALLIDSDHTAEVYITVLSGGDESGLRSCREVVTHM